MAERKRPTRCELVLKGLVEQDNPRAFYRGSWARVGGVLLDLIAMRWVDASFSHVVLLDAGLDAYVDRGLWAVRHG